MTDFSYLKKYDVGEKPMEFPLEMIEGTPVLMVLPATESNKKYLNVALAKSRRRGRLRQHPHVTAHIMKEDRELDRELYPKFIIKDWHNVVDMDGNEVPFSESNCADFIAQLPNWIFDELRAFAGNPASFTNGLASDEVVAGNLPNG